MVTAILITVIAGYLLGNLNGSILVSRLIVHDDVRRHGSGNAGLTNFFRNYGGFNSLLVILIDVVKAVAACLIGKAMLSPFGYALEGTALGAAAVGLGHDFPAFLGFKGGKGILSGFASVCVLDWRVALIAFVVFAVIYFSTKYVSLSSVLGAAALGTGFMLLHWHNPWAIAACWFFCLFAIFMHRENIVRLLNGTERKTDFFKREKKS